MKSRSMLILIAMLLLAACGGGEAASGSAGGEDVDIDFPHIDGADRIDAATLDDGQVPYAASDAVGSLHVADGRSMEVLHHYTMALPLDADSGWTMVDSRTDSYTMALTLTNGQRMAFISFIPGAVMRQFPDKAEGHDLTPFEAGTDDVGSDQVLIHTEIATCDEQTVDDCIRAVFDTLYPPLQIP